MNKSFDAMPQGVKPGGLRTKNQIRVLLCYLLKNIDSEISKNGLNELIQETSLANFFEIGDALSQLTEEGNLSENFHDGDRYYSLTSKGESFVEDIDTELPLSVRKEVVNTAIGIVAREKMRGTVETHKEKLERGYHVTLSVKDGDTVMMQTVLYAADSVQAEAVMEKFTSAPEKLYGGIIDILTAGN